MEVCKNCGHELGRNGYETLMHVLPNDERQVRAKCRVKHPFDDKWECSCENAELSQRNKSDDKKVK